MLPQLYNALTTYEGMYVFYLIPIVYFLVIVVNSLYSCITQKKSIGFQEIVALLAILIICADFIRYLYLFLSGTGKLLQPTGLFVKYAIGFLIWLWVIGYSYNVYFSRQTAGQFFNRRVTIMAILFVGSLVLGGIVIALS
ncbi:hypothetical protein CSA56_16365 [candidate division KSB3 bacterium]|uniref:Uncharacterized protein n=1 Tax=candidate division KSB3 bacterium TaxID=2044937 RepID=A0A2G6K938_9BACT|nr:MAG: hypothetical protein CSA56_16365 [candidate division KSB3 bacterium]